jgi:cobalamin biosynthesis protein CbiD
MEMQAGNPKTKTQAHQRFNDLKGDIRNELERIVEDRDSSNGLEVLKKSLALSGTYRDLIGRIQTAESQDQLDALFDNIQTEKDVYEQRARHLQQLFEQRAELIRASNVNLDDVLAEVKQLNPTTTDDCDF